jgi:hypothetical protein
VSRLYIYSSIVGVFLLAFAAILILLMAIELVRLRFRRLFSLACAVIAMHLIFFTIARITIFSPYYWYFLLNQSRFEGAVEARTRPGSPAFVKLEQRNVSTGLAINAPTFTAIVYDESDELGHTPAERSASWNAQHGKELSMDQGGAPRAYTARRLHAHFYLVTW